jgi:alkylation response protein AidB-like acyl-CoA dehydrogenase
MSSAEVNAVETAQLSTLPGDDVRQIMWRYADRFDLQMLVQSSRSVARGPVARLVADGARNSHEWTDEKNDLLKSFDEAGITSAFMEPEHGGYVEGPKNLALSLMAFELAWVDGGSATGSLAGNLALSPIHEKGTPEQKAHYLGGAVPVMPGEDRKQLRGAFALTEPLPYVGVDTGVLGGKVRVAEWNEGEEPMLHVDKRGRFITNMAFANFISAAVDSDDERIKGSCLVILEETDEGTYDRGVPTRKLVHQLSSTRDPAFSLKIPASRIIGGYTIQDGVIVPNFNHGQVIESVFKRTRVTVGLMTSAKLLSAIEPVIRYQRGRFRGGQTDPGTPRHELGLQMKEDALHRLVDIWATGEAASSLGFETARLFDEYDMLEKQKEEFLETEGITGRQQLRYMRSKNRDAADFVRLTGQPESERDTERYTELENDFMTQYLVKDSVANVLCPATKLWNTGHGANMMREAVSLMGGYGITEDCPGFLGQKWMDAQLEATYEGPESVQRRQLSVTMTNEVFLAQFQQWIYDMRVIANERPGTGACALGTAMTLWMWTLRHLLLATDADGNPLYKDQRQGVTFPMADALCWLISVRQFILDLIELDERGAENPVLAEALPGYVQFYTDLAHVQVARSAGEVGRICTELIYGYNRHPSWNDPKSGSCMTRDELISAESLIPGISAAATLSPDFVGEDGSHAPKAGPCVDFRGMNTFQTLRNKLDGCITGAALAKDRAARSLTEVMIPEALDYPA